mgnify:CR=1 FL=1|tara:strand:+ start:1761 stop:3350 length:1590 start_codon:yes stop_codon:yes gene_type:complete
MAFDTEIQALAGSATQSEMDQWMTDGAKEIINMLPPKLKEKCMTESTITNSPSYLSDLDGIGEILHVTRLSADSGGYRVPCRKVPSMYGEMTGDSTNMMYYATATDPAYWITSSNDAVILNVNPTPTANQTAIVYHVGYPSIDASAVSTIANFPDEAEYLVVLYASIKVLQNKMNEMTGNSDVATAFTAVNTELDETQAICDLINTQVDSAVSELGEAATQVDAGIDTALAAIVTASGRINTAVALANAEFDKSDALLTLGETDSEGDVNTALALLKAAVDQAETACDKFENADTESIFGDEDTFLTASSQLAEVKDALDNVKAMYDTDQQDDDSGGAAESVLYWLNDEDPEMVQATIAAMGAEIQRAQANLAQWNSIGDMRVKEINACLAEANGYSQEIQTRLAQSQSKISASNARIAAGNAYLQEAGASAQEAQSYASEVNSRISQVGGYNQVVSGYINAAQGYASEIQSKIAISQGYIAEASARMAKDDQDYKWYQSQQVKLQQDYNTGIGFLLPQEASPRREERD